MALSSVAHPGAVPLSFNHRAGFVEEPFSLVIKGASSNQTVRYTLDGSEPSTNAPVFGGAIGISNSVVVRAACFSGGSKVSRVFTHTFLFTDGIVHQTDSPSGYPLGSNAWNGFPAHYEMSAAISDSPVYRERVRKGLRSLPTLAIATGPEALFGTSKGIYLHSQERGPAWERPCAVEFFLPDGSPGFSLDCGLRVQGNSNRIPEKTPKRSFRLLFREEYGPSHLRYPVFPDSKLDRFNTLVLRAEFNNSWTHWNPVSQVRGQRIRDAWLKDSQRALGWTCSHSRFVHLYLNGLYWGVYDLTERPDATFAAGYFGGHRTDYDVVNEQQSKDGDLNGFTALMGISQLENPVQYQKLQRMLDVREFIDYLLVNFYAGNLDWGETKNWYAIGRRSEPQSFRFLCWDGEFILQDPGENVVGGGAQPFHILGELRANPDFMALMADRIQKHFFDDGALTAKPAIERWMKRAHELDVAIVDESARWGGYRRQPPYNRDVDWMKEQERIMTQWFPQRTGIVLEQLRAAGLYPSINPPQFISIGTNSTVISLVAETNCMIYFTTNGADPRLAVKNSPNAGATGYSNSVTMRAPALVKARAKAGQTWSALVERRISRVSDGSEAD